MNIPPEFIDYLTTSAPLSPKEQEERFVNMHVDEIIYRAKLMWGLNFDKETTKKRIKQNYQWAFELGGLPTIYKTVDNLVNDVYKKSSR